MQIFNLWVYYTKSNYSLPSQESEVFESIFLHIDILDIVFKLKWSFAAHGYSNFRTWSKWMTSILSIMEHMHDQLPWGKLLYSEFCLGMEWTHFRVITRLFRTMYTTNWMYSCHSQYHKFSVQSFKIELHTFSSYIAKIIAVYMYRISQPMQQQLNIIAVA